MDQLVKLLVEVGAAVFAGWAANKVVEKTTGYSIPQHFYNWWCGVRDEILKWLKSHEHLKLTGKVVVFVTQKLETLMVTPLHIEKLFFKAETTNGEYIEITTRELSVKEALEVFPKLELANQTEMPMSLTN